MELLQGLLGRVSVPSLTDPGPTPQQLENLYQAALRAPDHGNLKPFRFIIIAGDARQQLGAIFARQQ